MCYNNSQVQGDHVQIIKIRDNINPKPPIDEHIQYL